MNTPMFDQPDNEVTTLWKSDGLLQVIIGKPLGVCQRKAFIAGASRVRGVRSVNLDTLATYASDQTCFVVSLRPNYAAQFNVLQSAMRLYTESFLRHLLPEPDPVQPTLF